MRRFTALVPLLALCAAILLGGIVLALAGADPLRTYAAMIQGAFGTPRQWIQGDFYNLSETMVKAIPLMLCGLGVSVSFRMLFWNIGAEGQLVAGAIGASGVALAWGDRLPSGLVLPLMVLAGFAAGAAWGLPAAVLRAKLQVNEIITTLMMNYIAILLMEYLFYGPWKDPKGHGFPGSAEFGPAAWLPRLPGSRVHLGLVLALIAAVLVALALNRARFGYEVRAVGENPRAAELAGISLSRQIILVAIVSAGLAGLAGMTEIAGITHRLQKGIAVGYGYSAIIVAWLARLGAGRTLVWAFLLGALLVGGDQVQIVMKLPSSIALVLQGAILCCLLAGDFLVRRRAGS